MKPKVDDKIHTPINEMSHLRNSFVYRKTPAHYLTIDQDSNSRKLRTPSQSFQNKLKLFDQHKDNNVILNKMLKIMNRPQVTEATSF